MKNRKFLVSMATLVSAVSSQQALANTNVEEKVIPQTSFTQTEISKSSQNPFDFVLKRVNESQAMSYHSSHMSHSSHRSHYSSGY